MKTALTLFAICIACLILASCQSSAGAITPGAIAAIAAGAMGIVEAVTPLMTPEQAASLEVIAGNIDGTIRATQTAVSVIAEVLGSLQDKVGAGAVETANGLNELAQGLSEVPSRMEVQLTSVGAGSGALGGSRLMSHYKHPAKP